MKSKERAEQYFSRISDGHTNAIQRPSDSYVDRGFREMIEKANKNGDCIINTGFGVFRPIPGDEIDEAELNKYLAKELHRARAIQIKRIIMKQTFNSWRRAAEWAEQAERKERGAKEN